MNHKVNFFRKGNSLKILTLIFGSLKCVFAKCTFSGPQLSWRGLVWYLFNSSIAHAPCARPAGLKKHFRVNHWSKCTAVSGAGPECRTFLRCGLISLKGRKGVVIFYQARRAAARSAAFSRIKKIPYQAPPTQLGPRKCTF